MAAYTGAFISANLAQRSVVFGPRDFDDVDNVYSYGSIIGTSKIKTAPTVILPVQAIIWLIRDNDLQPLRRVLSNPITGAFEFLNVPTAWTYTIHADYIGSAFRSVLANGISPS